MSQIDTQLVNAVREQLRSVEGDTVLGGPKRTRELLAGPAAGRYVNDLLGAVVEAMARSGDGCESMPDAIQCEGAAIVLLAPERFIPSLIGEIVGGDEGRAFGALQVLKYVDLPEGAIKAVGPELSKALGEGLRRLIQNPSRDEFRKIAEELLSSLRAAT